MTLLIYMFYFLPFYYIKNVSQYITPGDNIQYSIQSSVVYWNFIKPDEIQMNKFNATRKLLNEASLIRKNHPNISRKHR